MGWNSRTEIERQRWKRVVHVEWRQYEETDSCSGSDKIPVGILHGNRNWNRQRHENIWVIELNQFEKRCSARHLFKQLVEGYDTLADKSRPETQSNAEQSTGNREPVDNTIMIVLRYKLC